MTATTRKRPRHPHRRSGPSHSHRGDRRRSRHRRHPSRPGRSGLGLCGATRCYLEGQTRRGALEHGGIGEAACAEPVGVLPAHPDRVAGATAERRPHGSVAGCLGPVSRRANQLIRRPTGSTVAATIL